MPENTSERLKAAFTNAAWRAEHDRKLQGKLGKYNGASWDFDVTGKAGYVYVTLVQGGAATTVVEALNNNVPRQGGRPVLLDKLPSGELIITGSNPDQVIVYQGSTSTGVGDVPYHDHAYGSGLEYEHPSQMFSAGRVYVVSGLIVYIAPFHFRWNGAEYYWPGDNFNLSAYRPGTSNHHAWVKVGINPAATPIVAVATTGTSQSTAAPLTRDQLDDIDFTSYVPCMGIKLTNGQTTPPSQLPAVNGGDFEDIRLFLSGTGGSASGSGGTVDPRTFEARLTLESGVPISTSDQTAKGTVYLTPYNGNLIALPDGGGNWDYVELSSEISLSLAGLTASRMHDLWVYNNSGAVALDYTAWTDDTNRATALTLVDGVWCKAGDTTRKLAGAIYVDGSNQCTIRFAGGTTAGAVAQLDLDNVYNRAELEFPIRETATTWNSPAGSAKTYWNSTTNRMYLVRALNEAQVDALMAGIHYHSGGVGTAGFDIGIDSTSVGSAQIKPGSNSGNGILCMGIAYYVGKPGIGRHYIQAEQVTNSTFATTFYGDINVPADYQSGMIVRTAA